MNEPTDHLGLLNRSRRPAGGDGSSMTESEDTIRNLKASQSVEAAFLAVGMPNPPSNVAAIITNQVKGAIKNLPLDQVRNMTPGSGPLGTALAAVDQYVGMLTPQQRAAAEQKMNTLGPVDMLKLHALMGGLDRGSGTGESSSSRRYDNMAQAALNETQRQALDLARKVGLDWAANNPDLLRLGPSAIQALADVHYREESFKKLKEVGFSTGDQVGVAKFAKKTGRDANQIADQISQSNRALATDEGGKVNPHVMRELHDAEMTYMANPDSAEAKQGLSKAIAKSAGNDPKKKEEGRKLEEKLGTQKKVEVKAENKADNKDSKADAKTTTAKKDVAVKQAAKSRLLSSLD